jgi:hypothetical protein
MPVTKVGYVYYTDDPHKRVFRVVYPELDDSELDQPATTSNREIMRKIDGSAHGWHTFGIDETRQATLIKVAPGTKCKVGTPWVEKDEPMIYLINIDVLPDGIENQVESFIAARPKWSCFSNLGSGVAADIVAAADIIHPSWIICVDGDPGIGTLQRTRKIANHDIGLWVV